ncbi:hypothetical protein BpHYR1_029686 [Brachionus plicatilis]|uniref:Uncharacterized protein n=1 Tax=Brachionus plicatilis TaxID=10195 RepID=A0A3M7SBI0_BRAPC|nr:hypothetical protein BpHYR1_029686 [Brachionus plicatilis]
MEKGSLSANEIGIFLFQESFFRQKKYFNFTRFYKKFWQKNYICKRIITVALNLNICDIPEADLKIEGNRTRERPKIAKPAWMRSEPPNLPEIDTLTIAPSSIFIKNHLNFTLSSLTLNTMSLVNLFLEHV